MVYLQSVKNVITLGKLIHRSVVVILSPPPPPPPFYFVFENSNLLVVYIPQIQGMSSLAL